MIPASAALDLSFNFVTPSRQVCEVPRQLYWVDPCREFRLLTSQPLSRLLPVLFLCLLRRSQFILLLPFRFLEQLVVALLSRSREFCSDLLLNLAKLPSPSQPTNFG
jgi:hypothetical protein